MAEWRISLSDLAKAGRFLNNSWTALTTQTMTDEQRREEAQKPSKSKAIASAVLADGSLAEMLHQPDERKTALCIWKDGVVRIESSVHDRGQTLVPYSPGNNLLAHEVVLLPSEPLEYGSDSELVAEIRSFIHAY